MAQQPAIEITQPVLSQRPIDPGRPVGDGGNGGNGGGGGCMPGTSLLDLSLVTDPNTLFVAVDTPVQLTGSGSFIDRHEEIDMINSLQRSCHG